MRRRDFLAGIGATGAYAAASPAIANVSLGTAKLTTVSDGSLVLPADFIFAPMPSDESLAIRTEFGVDGDQLTPECNLALYRDEDRTVLFDVIRWGEAPGEHTWAAFTPIPCESVRRSRGGAVVGVHEASDAAQDALQVPVTQPRARGEPKLGLDVLLREQQHRLRRRAIATRAADLLHVRLGGSGNVEVHDEPDIRLVDPHAERVRRADDAALAAEEAILDVLLVRWIEARVERLQDRLHQTLLAELLPR